MIIIIIWLLWLFILCLYVYSEPAQLDRVLAFPEQAGEGS